MNTFGQQFRLSIWGESHGAQVGITLDGIPAGIPLTAADFSTDLNRRKSGAVGTTPRQESDCPQFLSGIYADHTTGAPLTIAFTNEATQSADYPAAGAQFRPSHADQTAFLKYNGYNDPRGGGHFSGRLTVALTAAGVVAKKLLPKFSFQTQITEIGGCTDPAQFESCIAAATAAHDSVGGIVECRVKGIEAGLGEPFFDSVEGLLSHLLFSIPGVKGVEFGDGFGAAHLRGSQHNDAIINALGTTVSNHAGGMVGGITNSNELILRAAFKPTPSIAQEQITFDPNTGSLSPLTIRGRHDVCIALRGAVVVEAATAIALADLLLRRH
ncbi:MAG: chorismate synthase [Alistipes sp.]